MTRPDLIGRLLVMAQFGLLAWFIWPLTPQTWSLPALALALVLVAKGMLEEPGLRANFPGYAEYAKRVRRFIPGVF